MRPGLVGHRAGAAAALETWLAPETDEATRTRLQFDVEVAYLAEHDLTGRTLTTKDLVDCVTRLQPLMSLMDAERMRNVIGRFFDLVLAQAVPSDEGNLEASGRLLAALARRRIKAQLERSLEGAMHSLVPLLTNVGRDRGEKPADHICAMRSASISGASSGCKRVAPSTRSLVVRVLPVRSCSAR